MSIVTVREVARMFGINLPGAPGKAKCPFRKHARPDKTFRVFQIPDGKELWKCWSCDEPDNVGDAVQLYARLASVPRKEAWKTLRDRGYEVPGQDRSRPASTTGRSDDRGVSYEKKPKIGIRGTQPARALRLPKDTLEAWQSLDDAAVRDFLVGRGFPEDFDFRFWSVTAMPDGCIGFIYVDPMTGEPCRVKVRPIREKRFWNLPKPDPSQPGAKALAPLFLSHHLGWGTDSLDVIITEGELDALALCSVGLRNVVSLPDGSESASTVSLVPLAGIFRRWFVAVDDDEPGVKAWRVLRDRAREAGAEPIRVTWATIKDDELLHYKDANAALAAGFDRSEFERCISVASGKLAIQR